MKKKLSYLILISFGLMVLGLSYHISPVKVYAANSCYKCKDRKFVCYSGGDTLPKREKAFNKFKCEVTGISSCSKVSCKGRTLN